jgi:hypothetical protein
MRDAVAAALPAGASAMPYFAVYELAGAATAPHLEDFAGLELVHRIQTESPPAERLVTYWRSRDHWSAQDEKLRRALAASEPVLSGSACDAAARPKPFWRRLHLQTWVLGFAALLGALDAIGNHYEWLFSRPLISLTVKEPLGPGPIAGRSFGATVMVSNATRIEHRDLRISAILMPLDGAGKPTALAVVPKTIAALSPGSATEIEFAGEAPMAGRYEFQVKVTGRAGWLVGEGSFPLTRALRVWPSAPVVKWDLKRQSAGFARIDAILSLGVEAQHGVDCRIFLFPHHSEGKPILDFFDATDTRWIVDDNTPGAERESLSWHGPAAAREEKPFSCAIPVSPSTDLATLKSAISVVSCTKSEGGS